MSYCAEIAIFLQCMHIVCPIYHCIPHTAQHVMFQSTRFAFSTSVNKSLPRMKTPEQQVIYSAVSSKDIEQPWEAMPRDEDTATETRLPEAQRTLPLLNGSIPDL
jgi:hypothetical protein